MKLFKKWAGRNKVKTTIPNVKGFKMGTRIKADKNRIFREVKETSKYIDLATDSVGRLMIRSNGKWEIASPEDIRTLIKPKDTNK